MKKILLSAAIAIVITLLQAKGPVPADVSMANNHAPLSFLENKGQVMDQNRQARPDIQFSIKAAPGLNIFIGKGAIHYQFSKAEGTGADKGSSSQQKSHLPLRPLRRGILPRPGAEEKTATYTMYRMDVELIGANANAEVVTEQKQDYYENYFNERTGEHGARAYTYNCITYKNIYPNIDWVLYMKDGQLEHEFLIHQGGRASDIQLKYGGATGLQLNADGSLTATTPQGTITEQAPKSYQPGGTPVKSGFKLSGDVLTYETGRFKGELVIDPTLVWGTYYGGSGQDWGSAISTSSDDVFITGWTNSQTNIATTGAHQTSLYPSSGTEGFLAKFNSAGQRYWATYFEGNCASANLQPHKVAADNSGNVFITSNTTCGSGIATVGAYQTTYGGAGVEGYGDAMLAKFDSTGALKWATYFGGSGDEQGLGLATDLSGNVYLSGATNSTSGIATSGAFQTSYNGLYAGSVYNAFLAKFNSGGAMQWATYFNGTTPANHLLQSTGNAVATDDSGNVYMTGYTTSDSGLATVGAYQTVNNSANDDDAYLVKFNSAGARLWATYYGGSQNNLYTEGQGVAIDGSGNVYMAGFTNCSSNIATAGAYQTTYSGGTSDGYLTKFNNTGAIQWATYFGGSGDDIIFGVTADPSGNVYVGGTTNSGSGIASTGAYQSSLASTYDGFLADFNTNGLRVWSTYYTSGNLGNADGFWGIAADGAGNVYGTGLTDTTAGLATSGAFQTTFGGGTGDAFLVKFSGFCNPPVVGAITGPTTLCALGTITLTDTTSGGTWASSNTNLATVSSGEVSGVVAGLDTITYSVTNGCGTTTVSYPVTVNAAPTVNAVANQTVCAGDTTTTIHFTGTGTGTTYNWTCNNTSIGLAASGTGNIGSFTAVNIGSTPIVDTVTVTPVAAGYAYIANGGDSTITVINTSTNAITATIVVGQAPAGVVVSPDGSKVYVTNSSSGSVSVISTATNTVVATVIVATAPYGIAVTPDGSKVYVACQYSDTVSVINASNNTVMAAINTGGNLYPFGVVVSPDGSKAYVTSNNNTGKVVVISTTSNTIISAINVGSQPLGIAVSPDGSSVYVANDNSNTVSVINTSTNIVTTNINVGHQPIGLAVSLDGSKIYVTSLAGHSVDVINAATNIVSDTIRVGSGPVGVSVSPGGSMLYVANEDSNSVSVINTADNMVVATVPVGTYPYSLGNFITGGNGCTGTPATFTITVNPQPTAAITGTATACGVVSLTATGGTTYTWSGGNTPNTAANTFNTSNTYTVTVSNGGNCSATASKAVTVNTIPTATITPAGATTFCDGDSVILTASAGTTYLWSNTATTQSIPVKTGGSYTVEVGNASCSATSTATVVTVNALPNAAINGPTTICSSTQATLTASGGTGYSWNNGLDTNAQVNVQPTNTTTYIVTVSNANNCSATAQQTVTVTNTPTASISGPTEVCSGNGIMLTANGGNTYSWAGGLGSNAAITVSPTSTTTYTVTATIGVNCSASASQTITVNQPASSQFSQSICAGGSYSFNNRNLTAGGAYYDTLQTIHTCDSIVTLKLTVNNAVQTTINDTTCKGTAFVFNGRSLNQAGVYKDTLQAASTCDSIITLSLVIDSVATPTITRNGDTLQTQSFSSYQWLRNGAAVSGTTQSIIVVQDGNYSVVVTGAKGCSDTSAVLNVTGLGVNEIASGYGVKLYPNPNNGNFVLEFTDDVVRDVEITDAIGRSVVAASKVTKQQNFVLDELAAGIYILRISEGGEVRSLKFSVVK